MTLTNWQMYWIVQLDSFATFFTITAAIGFIALFGSTMAYFMMKSENVDTKYLSKHFKWFLPLYAFIILGAIFTPSTKDMIAIIAVPAVVNNQDVQEIPANAAKLFNEKLKQWLDEMERGDAGIF